MDGRYSLQCVNRRRAPTASASRRAWSIEAGASCAINRAAPSPPRRATVPPPSPIGAGVLHLGSRACLSRSGPAGGVRDDNLRRSIFADLSSRKCPADSPRSTWAVGGLPDARGVIESSIESRLPRSAPSGEDPPPRAQQDAGHVPARRPAGVGLGLFVGSRRLTAAPRFVASASAHSACASQRPTTHVGYSRGVASRDRRRRQLLLGGRSPS